MHPLLYFLCIVLGRFPILTSALLHFVILYAWSNFVVRCREKEAWVFIGVGGNLLWRLVELLQITEIRWKGDDGWNWLRGTSVPAPSGTRHQAIHRNCKVQFCPSAIETTQSQWLRQQSRNAFSLFCHRHYQLGSFWFSAIIIRATP